jgi:hypothetical protein
MADDASFLLLAFSSRQIAHEASAAARVLEAACQRAHPPPLPIDPFLTNILLYFTLLIIS